MKKKEKYRIINYGIEEYGRIFDEKYQRTSISQKYIKQLLKKYRHSTMCEWCYCCNGIYHNCWQELYADGVWGMSQKDVDRVILDIACGLVKNCKRDNRVGLCIKEDMVSMVIIARDLPGHAADYLISFTNREDL